MRHLVRFLRQRLVVIFARGVGIETGLEEKAKEFREKGSELYS